MCFSRVFQWKAMLFLVLLTGFFFIPAIHANAEEPVVVVIDPGHGGENLGAEYENCVEKDMNLIVAEAMYEELLKYENVEVYLTHTEDVDMTLAERALFAAEKNADFLFCLHFNMSPNHNLFGTEVWISAFGEAYSKGMSFGTIQIKQMEALGLYSRGVKTKLKENGESDYYGIIRESTALGLPCALIEHCHLDHDNDKPFYGTDEQLKQFGILDATSVAQYFGLKSTRLNVDYSDYEKPSVPVPSGIIVPDATDPDICFIEENSADYSSGTVSIKLSAQDFDSPMLYFDYSYDGGMTWSQLFAWPGGDTIEFSVTAPSGTAPVIIARAYNLFDRYTESNQLTYPTFSYNTEEPEIKEPASLEEAAEADSDQVKISFEKKKKAFIMDSDTPFLNFLLLCFIVTGILFVIVLITRLALHISRRNKRRKK